MILKKNLEIKYRKLREFMTGLDRVVIAFSGGVDSSVLSKVAYDCLGQNALSVTACSPTYTPHELQESKRIARKIGIRQVLITTKEFGNRQFLKNSQDRCYWCKRELFKQLRIVAKNNGTRYVLDGTNVSDAFDNRPGLQANKEYCVISPFFKYAFTKPEIRDLARKFGLSVWNKPQGACLASRIPCGEKITVRKLKRISQAERLLHAVVGAETLLRARDHGDLVRLEFEKSLWTKLIKSDINSIIKKLKKIGYKYITVDIEGYVPAGLRSAHKAYR